MSKSEDRKRKAAEAATATTATTATAATAASTDGKAVEEVKRLANRQKDVIVLGDHDDYDKLLEKVDLQLPLVLKAFKSDSCLCERVAKGEFKTFSEICREISGETKTESEVKAEEESKAEPKKAEAKAEESKAKDKSKTEAKGKSETKEKPKEAKGKSEVKAEEKPETEPRSKAGVETKGEIEVAEYFEKPVFKAVLSNLKDKTSMKINFDMDGNPEVRVLYMRTAKGFQVVTPAEAKALVEDVTNPFAVPESFGYYKVAARMNGKGKLDFDPVEGSYEPAFKSSTKYVLD